MFKETIIKLFAGEKFMNTSGNRLLPMAGLPVCLLAAKAFLWFSSPVYSANAVVKIEDNQNELSALSGIITGKTYSSRILSESPVIKSRRIIYRSLHYLDWKTSYYLSSGGKISELYPHPPFHISIIQQYHYFYTDAIGILFLGNGKYRLTYRVNGNTKERVLPTSRAVHLPGIVFRVVPGKQIRLGANYLLRFNTVAKVVARVGSGLSINESSKFSNVAILSKTDTHPVFAADAVNAVLRAYLAYDREQRWKNANQVVRFIDRQLGPLYGEVRRSGEKIRDFKERAALNDPFPISNPAGRAATDQLELLDHEHLARLKTLDFLIEKKLEAGIGQSSVVAGAVPIDFAVPDYMPLYPDPGAVWRSAWIAGLLSIAAAAAYQAKHPPGKKATAGSPPAKA